jgi:adenosylhomocysteine nucleosidase
LLVEKTIVYDIIEQMGDFDEHIRHYTTDLDLSWLGEPLPIPVRRTMLVSGDRDLLVEDISSLQQKYQAVAGDWESGAIAWVAKRNDLRLLILRGVTDLVGSIGSPAYGDMNFFETAAFEMMGRLVKSLPGWFSIIQS